MWNDIENPPADDVYSELKCSDGVMRSGIACHYPDGRFHGWMVDETEDFKKGIKAEFTVTHWREIHAQTS
jgi:hypothetical protein